MDPKKTGELIRRLRKEKKYTQLELAETLCLSDKTVSKWERGIGLPDVGLLNDVAAALGVNIETLLSGDDGTNENDGGNMKNICFYVCPICGNVITATDGADISCCGRKLEALKAAQAVDGEHTPKAEISDGEYYVTFKHEMTKKHYIEFAAFVSYDRVLLIKMYPEAAAELRFAYTHGGKLYYKCSEHGLFATEL